MYEKTRLTKFLQQRFLRKNKSEPRGLSSIPALMLYLATGLSVISTGCAVNTDGDPHLAQEEVVINSTLAVESATNDTRPSLEGDQHLDVSDYSQEKIKGKKAQNPQAETRNSKLRVHKAANSITAASSMVAHELFEESYLPGIAPSPLPLAAENYARVEQNGLKLAVEEPVSTFSIDVDTGSYANIRRMLKHGSLPPKDAVRVEEMINYFSYDYRAPNSPETPFNIQTELASSPWSENHVLLKIGLKGYEVPLQERPSANLVFLLDVSGSMNSPNKLPLLKKSLILLSKQLNENDRVSVVVYAGASGVVLEPTKGDDTLKIESALNRLSAGGSTNGRSGIELAYELAKQNYIVDGINRVMLATDGDFNVGTSDVESLKNLIEEKRKDGITLTTLGFGAGNYNDHLMEQLADVGNGNYAYIDSFSEARKVLVEELNGTLMTIAKDVKVQIEFNSAVVKQYRLIGYENRSLAREDFNNDKVDAGEIGAGHTVTALYELVLQDNSHSDVEPLRYQHLSSNSGVRDADLRNSNLADELAFVRFRYKAPAGIKSRLLEQVIQNPGIKWHFADASQEFRFAATVAHFGEALRSSKYVDSDYEMIINNAIQSKGVDIKGYRSEFVQLVQLAAELSKG